MGTEKARRVEAEDVLPGYMLKLCNDYKWRNYWFELFETLRKVLLVGVPAAFPGRGGVIQLFYGLLVAFFSFGGYMLYRPLDDPNDQRLSQMCQTQIFLTLVSSAALREQPPNFELNVLVTVSLFAMPVMAFVLETPLIEWLPEMPGKITALLGLLGVGRPFLGLPQPTQRTRRKGMAGRARFRMALLPIDLLAHFVTVTPRPAVTDRKALHLQRSLSVAEIARSPV